MLKKNTKFRAKIQFLLNCRFIYMVTHKHHTITFNKARQWLKFSIIFLIRKQKENTKNNEK